MNNKKNKPNALSKLRGDKFLRRRCGSGALPAALVLLTTLGLPGLLLRHSPARNLLLVSPVEDNASGFDPQTLRTIAEDEFLLTYEVRRRLLVRTAYADHPVTVIGTNSLYPALTSFPLLRGGFFTAAAEKGQRKEVVLNRAAAFQLFGGNAIDGRTLSIEGALWLVTGVMDDGEEDTPRVYIPAAAGGERPRSLLALLGGDVDAARVKSALLPLGVNEASHVFFDLSAAIRLYQERLALALRVFACALFCVFARRQAAVLKAHISALKVRLKHAYTGELLQQSLREQSGKPLRFALTVLALAGGGAFCFSLLLQCLTICLGWGDMPSLPAVLGKGDFPAIVAPLLAWYYPGALAFALCLTFSGLIPFFTKINAP